MDENLCRCGRWVVEAERGIWAHDDDMAPPWRSGSSATTIFTARPRPTSPRSGGRTGRVAAPPVGGVEIVNLSSGPVSAEHVPGPVDQERIAGPESAGRRSVHHTLRVRLRMGR